MRAVLGCAVAVCLSLPAAAAAGRPPNIVFVMADDLGYGDLSCYGQTRFQTPNLDKLAAEGVKFTDFYAGASVCAPSRCVLMTGLHGGHAFIRGNGDVNLRPSDVTVAELLKSRGYATGLFGKWGLGHEGSAGVPTKQGFDEFFGYLSQHHAHNYYPTFLLHNETRVPLRNVVPNETPHGSGVSSNKLDYSADLIQERVLKFVEDHKDEPFFLYYAATLPHANNEAGKAGMEIPDLGEYADKDWPEPQKGLAAMIAKLDADVGELTDKLDELGLSDDTVVFFTSDNGPHNEGGNQAEFFDSSGPLRGTKRSLHDGGIRVPMIVRWPGHAQARTTSRFAGYFADFLPTAAAIAGVEPPAGLDGISFLPAILGETQPPHDFLYWEFYELGDVQAVRMGNWKAIRPGFDAETVRLYDLSKDIHEDHDVAAAHPEVAARALAVMQREHVPSPSGRSRSETEPQRKTK